jgi:DamX protein
MNGTESQSDSRYLASLGLARAPFPVGADAIPFFRTEALTRTLESVLYLARYSDLIALICGPAGSGKSALRREIARAAGSNVHVASISGDANLNPSALCARILESFSLVEAYPQLDEQLRQIREQIDLLQRKGYHFLLLVDDANELPNESIALLESLASLRDEASKAVVKLVLFAPRLESLYLGGPTLRHRLKMSLLAALTAEETLGYLKHRIEHAGGAALFDQVFRTRDIARIARESRGRPGAANALAQQLLLKHVARTDPKATPPDAPRQGRLQIAVASALGVALVAGFVFQSEITEYIASAGTQPAVAQAPAQSATPVAMEAPVELAAATANPITDIALEMFANAPATRIDEPAGVSDAVPVSAATLAPVGAKAAAAPPAAEQEVAKTAAAPKAASAEPPAKLDVVDVEVQEQRWILAQNPASYTIQIVGSPDRGDVRRALKRHQFQEITAMFEARRKDRPWYGLMYGLYPDFATANKARTDLPGGFADRAQIRRVSSVQGEIAAPGDAPAESTDTAEVSRPAQ